MTIRKLAIAGVPRAGKTTKGRKVGVALGSVRHTDDINDLEWSKQSETVAGWFSEGGVVEGMTVPRALRKWLAANPEGKPVDEVVFMQKPHIELNEGQDRMGKGAKTIMDEITPELRRRGVEVHYE